MTNLLRSGWRGRLPQPAFVFTSKLVPVPCIDILPYRIGGTSVEIGLIEREDADGKRVWNLVGGGVHRQESLAAAVTRHIEATLGPDVTWERVDFSRPEMVGEYFPAPNAEGGHDPRKHAIALSYALPVTGRVSPRGEALDFRWFSEAAIPFGKVGFGQEYVIRGLLPCSPPPADRKSPR
jgi:ADP-ribose pyrophosphatase YjhB (NUDIX family)